MKAPQLTSSTFLLVLLLFFFFLIPQTKSRIVSPTDKKFNNKISGTVIDALSGEPLVMANIFFANTTMGTASGSDGQYILENIPPGNYVLIAQYIGYAILTQQINIEASKHYSFDIKLNPKPIESELVEIIAPDAKEWRKNYKKFEKEFIGRTPNAKECKILNPEILNFYTERYNNALVASAESLLEVENRALGYRLYIYISTFRLWNWENIQYVIYPRFEELVAENLEEKNRWAINRRKSYYGSLKHFLSAVAKRIIKKEQFSMHIPTYELLRPPISPNMLDLETYPDQSVKKLSFEGWIEVSFPGCESSQLQLERESVVIDTLGNCYSYAPFLMTGRWANDRVAETLPWNYCPAK